MIMQPESVATSDERLLGALAHLFGPVVALVIWATQKDKSRFVRFQALQALAFDLAVFVAAFVGVGCMVLLIFGTTALGMAGSLVAAGDEGTAGTLLSLISGLALFVPFLGWCVMILLIGAVSVARIVAAINVFQGRNFRYPWLGARVEKFLG